MPLSPEAAEVFWGYAGLAPYDLSAPGGAEVVDMVVGTWGEADLEVLFAGATRHPLP
jgi:hypothetical protein